MDMFQLFSACFIIGFFLILLVWHFMRSFNSECPECVAERKKQRLVELAAQQETAEKYDDSESDLSD